jgi:hypothetical protein
MDHPPASTIRNPVSSMRDDSSEQTGHLLAVAPFSKRGDVLVWNVTADSGVAAKIKATPPEG